MIIRVFFSIGLFLGFVCSLSGQTGFYTETKVISDEGYQYKCDVDNNTGLVTLSNITNKFTCTNWLNKDGSKIKEDVYFGRIPTLEQDD